MGSIKKDVCSFLPSGSRRTCCSDHGGDRVHHGWTGRGTRLKRCSSWTSLLKRNECSIFSSPCMAYTYDVSGERTGDVDVGADWPVWWMVNSCVGAGGINMVDYCTLIWLYVGIFVSYMCTCALWCVVRHTDDWMREREKEKETVR